MEDGLAENDWKGCAAFHRPIGRQSPADR
ncbi:MAG: hypothetical protein MZW92_25635 [Comamonadaceae bacterium]|nr:hypothetical protein [Comamonadaceae bacterium]